jgi:hypothetical protein
MELDQRAHERESDAKPSGIVPSLLEEIEEARQEVGVDRTADRRDAA